MRVPEGPEPECVDWARAQAQALLAARGLPEWVGRLTDEKGEVLAEIALAFAALLGRHRGPSWWWETAGGWAGALAVLWKTAHRPGAAWVQRLALVLAAWRAGALNRLVTLRQGQRLKERGLDALLRTRAFPQVLETAASWWERYQASVERERYEQLRAAVQEQLADVLMPAWRALDGTDQASSASAPQLWLGWRGLVDAELQQLQPEDLEQAVRVELVRELLDGTQRLGRAPGLEPLRAALAAVQVLASALGLEAAQRPPPGLGPPTQGPPAR